MKRKTRTDVNAAARPSRTAKESDMLREVREVEGVRSAGGDDFLADRGYKNPEEMRTKFALAGAIRRSVADRGLSQVAAAQATGVDQADISKILRGQVTGYSVWKLTKMVADLGGEAAISLRLPSGERQTIPVSSEPSTERKLGFA